MTVFVLEQLSTLSMGHSNSLKQSFHWWPWCSDVERNASSQILYKLANSLYKYKFREIHLISAVYWSCKCASTRTSFWRWVSDTKVRKTEFQNLYFHWKLLSYVAPKKDCQLLRGSFSRPTLFGGSRNPTRQHPSSIYYDRAVPKTTMKMIRRGWENVSNFIVF